jgi:hypothetical protein
MNTNTREALQSLKDCINDGELDEALFGIIEDYDTRAGHIARLMYIIQKNEEYAAYSVDSIQEAQEHIKSAEESNTWALQALAILEATDAEKAAAIETNEREAEHQPHPKTEEEARAEARAHKVDAFTMSKEIRVLLIWADEPDQIAGLEAVCGMTQAETIDDWIEKSCWNEDEHMKPFVGGKGTPEERRAAFRYALALQGTYPQ